MNNFWRSLTAALRLSVQGQTGESGEPRESGYVTRRQEPAPIPTAEVQNGD